MRDPPRQSKPEPEVLRNISGTGNAYSLEYGFRNFNGDLLRIRASLDKASVAESASEFGYRKEDIAALDQWYLREQKAAAEDARKEFFSGKVVAKDKYELERKLAEIKARNGEVQKNLDEIQAALTAEYRRRRLETYQKAGFRLQGPGVVEADIPALCRRNAPRVRPVAQAFAKTAESLGYGSEDLVGAVTAMAQTALSYEVPPNESDRRVIAGVLPPPQALVAGWGDCDTKSALIASILKGWPSIRLVGLEIPEHYLLAVHRIPRKGEAFLEYEGLPFVMIESAGPAWLPPGQVGDFTSQFIQSGKQFRIQPL
jgi:hypothetical protein